MVQMSDWFFDGIIGLAYDDWSELNYPTNANQTMRVKKVKGVSRSTTNALQL